MKWFWVSSVDMVMIVCDGKQILWDSDRWMMVIDEKRRKIQNQKYCWPWTTYLQHLSFGLSTAAFRLLVCPSLVYGSRKSNFLLFVGWADKQTTPTQLGFVSQQIILFRLDVPRISRFTDTTEYSHKFQTKKFFFSSPPTHWSSGWFVSILPHKNRKIRKKLTTTANHNKELKEIDFGWNAIIFCRFTERVNDKCV